MEEDALRKLFADHYWDSFEKDKELILKHVNAVLDKFFEDHDFSPRVDWET